MLFVNIMVFFLLLIKMMIQYNKNREQVVIIMLCLLSFFTFSHPRYVFHIWEEKVEASPQIII